MSLEASAPMHAPEKRVYEFRLTCATQVGVAGFAIGMGAGLLMQLIKHGPMEVWSPDGLVVPVTVGLVIAGLLWWGASIELLPSGLPYRFSRTDRGVLKWEEISDARPATFFGIHYVNLESRGQLAARLPISVTEPDQLRSFVRTHVPLSCPLRTVLDDPQS